VHYRLIVKLGTYRNLQRHRTVLPAVARLLDTTEITVKIVYSAPPDSLPGFQGGGSASRWERERRERKAIEGKGMRRKKQGRCELGKGIRLRMEGREVKITLKYADSYDTSGG